MSKAPKRLHKERDLGHGLVAQELVLPSLTEGQNRFCYGIAMGPIGELYLTKGSCIIKVSPSIDKAELYAGVPAKTGFKEGPRLEALFDTPLGLVCVDSTIYVAQSHGIRRIENEYVSDYAGNRNYGHKDGQKEESLFNNPTHVVAQHGFLYITDSFNHCIRIISPDGMVSSIGYGVKSTIDGTFDKVGFKYPRGIAVTPDSKLLVTESSGPYVRCLDLQKKEAYKYKIKRDADFKFSLFILPIPNGEYLVVDTGIDTIYHADDEGDMTVLIDKSGGAVANGPLDSASTVRPTAIALGSNGDMFWSEETGNMRFIRGIFRATTPTDLSPLLDLPQFSDLSITINDSRRTLYVHRGLLELYGVDISHLSILETATLPNGTAEDFLGVLLGSNGQRLAEPVQALQKHSRRLHCANITRASAKLTEYFEALLESALPSASLSQLLVAAQECLDYNYSQHIISLFKSETTRRQEQNPRQFETTDAELVSTAFALQDIQDETPFKATMPKDFSIERTIISSMKALANTLTLCSSPSFNSKSTIAPNFLFSIELQDGNKTYLAVHDFVLYVRWPYFKAIIDSGLGESVSREAVLPSDFPPSLLLHLVRYIYDNSSIQDEDNQDLFTVENAEYLLENGGPYHIIGLDGKACNDFSSYVNYCNQLITRNKWL